MIYDAIIPRSVTVYFDATRGVYNKLHLATTQTGYKCSNNMQTQGLLLSVVSHEVQVESTL